MLAYLVALLLAQAAPSPATPAPAPATPAPAKPAPEPPARSPGDDHRACLERCVSLNDRCRVVCDNIHGTDPLKRTGCNESCSDRGHACEGSCAPLPPGMAQPQNE